MKCQMPSINAVCEVSKKPGDKSHSVPVAPPSTFHPVPTLNLSLPGGWLCFLPPASEPHSINHSHLILVSWSSLWSLSLFLSRSPPLSLLSWPGLFCWTRSVCIFPDALAYAFPLIYNKLSLPYTGAGTSSFSHSV